MKFSRKFTMPSCDTFSMAPLADLACEVIGPGNTVVDPFARNCRIGTICNDINPDTKAEYHMDAIDFLKTLKPDTADVVLVDPPYSPRQISECYKAIGRKFTMQDAHNAIFNKCIRKAVDRIAKQSAKIIWCGWSTVGMTEAMGWKLNQVLILTHGGGHNDTLITVWERAGGLFKDAI